MAIPTILVKSTVWWVPDDSIKSKSKFFREIKHPDSFQLLSIIIRIRCSIKIDEPYFLCNFSLR